MTPYAAVARLQRLAPQDHRILCAGCAEALLDELGGMFPPVEEPHVVVLSYCVLLGCSFTIDAERPCALHPLIGQEESEEEDASATD